MKRRNFFKTTGIAAAGLTSSSLPGLANSYHNPGYDKYGGWTAK